MSSSSDLYKDENNVLKEELRRISLLLESSQTEKDEIGIKYQQLSKRLEEVLQLQVDELETEDGYEIERSRHQSEWKHELVDELSHSRTRLSQCQQQQQRQTEIVRELQEKVENYQERCTTLERNLSERVSRNRTIMSQDENDAVPSIIGNQINASDNDNLTVQLVEERNRSKSLSEVNSMLREQLEAATASNQILTSDIHRLTREWQKTRHELDIKEIEWKEEEQSYSEYLRKEHHRLMTLWHQILQFRHEYLEMKSSTERDLGVIRTDLRQTVHNITSACFTLYTNAPLEDTDPATWEIQRKSQEVVHLKHRIEMEKDELNEKIRVLKVELERKKSLLDEKDKVIEALNKAVHTLENVTIDSNSIKDNKSLTRMKEEIEYLRNILQTIAQRVVTDSEQQIYDPKQIGNVSGGIAFSSALIARTVSPSMDNSSFPSLGEATLLAADAALTNRRLQIEEFQTKLLATQEKIKYLKSALEECEEEKRRIQRQNIQISSRFELVVQDIQSSLRDKDRIRSVLDETGSERSLLEHTKQMLNEQVDILNVENDRLYSKMRELQQRVETTDNDKETIRFQGKQMEEDLKRTNNQLTKFIEQESQQRNELKQLSDTLKKIIFEKELILKEKNEIGKRLLEIQQMVRNLSTDNKRLTDDSIILNANIQSLQSAKENLIEEKSEALLTLENLKEEKTVLNRDKSNLELEKQKLRTKIIDLEQLESENKSALKIAQDSFKTSETQREQLDLENTRLKREKEDLDNQISLNKLQLEKISEELNQKNKSTDRLNENCSKLEQEKESLTQEKSELEVTLQSVESEAAEYIQINSVLRIEKEKLEALLYSSQQTLISFEAKKDELENELTDLKKIEDNLINQVNAMKKQQENETTLQNKTEELMARKLQELQEDFNRNLKQEEEKWKKIVEQKDLEKSAQEHKFAAEKSEFHRIFEEKRDELLRNHIQEIDLCKKEEEQIRKKLDDKLTYEITEKKRMNVASVQQISVLEKTLVELRATLNEKNSELEEVKKRFKSLLENETIIQAEIKSQLDHSKKEMEQTNAIRNKEKKENENRLLESELKHDTLIEKLSNLKVQLRNAEEARDKFKEIASDASKQIKDLEYERINFNQDKINLENKLSNEKREREEISKEHIELKENVQIIRLEKIDITKTVEDLKIKIIMSQESSKTLNEEVSELKITLRDVEQSRMELKREIQSSQRQLSSLKNELNVRDEEIVNQRALQNQAEQRELELRKEAANIKQRLMESEASRESFHKELLNLQRKMSDLEHRLKLQQETHKSDLETSYTSERNLGGQKVSLEKSLAESKDEIHDLRLRLNTVEGRAIAMENKVTKAEGIKQNVEARYASLQNALRVNLGLGLDSSIYTSTPVPPPGLSSRQSSPVRNRDSIKSPFSKSSSSQQLQQQRLDSRSKSSSPARQLTVGAVSDLDVELVHCALQDLVEKVHSCERERDEWKRQAQKVQRGFEDAKQDRAGAQSHLTQLRKTLANIESEKQNLSSLLSSARANVLQQEETIVELEKEKRRLLSQLSVLENSLSTSERSRKQYQDKLSQIKEASVVTEKERLVVNQAKENSENRVAKLEVQIQNANVENHKLQLMFTNKDTENKILEQRLERMSNNQELLEEKCSSIQKTSDTLSLSLSKSKEEEQNLKDKLRDVSLSLSQNVNSTQTTREAQLKIKQELLKSEKEKNSLQQSLQEQWSSVNEVKQQNRILQDKVLEYQKDLNICESKRRELETKIQLKTSQEVVERESLFEVSGRREEIKNLSEQIEELRGTLTETEGINRTLERSQIKLEKEKVALQKHLEKFEKEKNRWEENFSKSKMEKSNLGRSLAFIENENLELQRKVQSLQAKLAELEHHHSRRLKDLTGLQHQETTQELERLRTAQKQAEQLLDAREKTQKQRVLGLEKQVSTLKDQLEEEHRRWSRYHQRHSQTDSEISHLRAILDQSLRNVSNDPNQLEIESHKLDSTIESHIFRSPSITLTTPSKISKSPSPSKQTTPGDTQFKTIGVRRRLDQDFRN